MTVVALAVVAPATVLGGLWLVGSLEPVPAERVATVQAPVPLDTEELPPDGADPEGQPGP